MLAFAHGAGWEIYLAMLLVGIGIGFAFAAMANLIVEAVPPEQTGVATGMNTIVRTTGGAIGSQVAAGIITATLLNGVATERGFTIAFAASTGALLVGFAVGLLVPARAPFTRAEPRQEPAAGFDVARVPATGSLPGRSTRS
jgi:MFS family permease